MFSALMQAAASSGWDMHKAWQRLMQLAGLFSEEFELHRPNEAPLVRAKLPNLLI